MPVGKLWKFADKITQVYSCLLIKDPKKRENEVNGVAVFHSRNIKGGLTLISIWD